MCAGLRRVESLSAQVVLLLGVGFLAAGCVSVQGGPDRLYPVETEVIHARTLLEGYDNYQGLVADYYRLPPDLAADPQRMQVRNEIIARRMYIIDVEYSKYEAALTSERQVFGFGTNFGAAVLGIASTLTTPLRSAQTLSGVGAGLLAARGAYDSEVVIAKTIQIAQGYMRAQRDSVAAKQILPRRTESTLTYPLSAALHDLEDYYRAGTLSAGLIDALRDSGAAATDASNVKADVLRGTFGADDATAALRRYITPGGKLNLVRLDRINDCLVRFQVRPANIRQHMFRKESAPIRAIAIRCAQEDPAFTG